MNLNSFQWTGAPKAYEVKEGTIRITTQPHTDLWQRTYYHFRNDNAPVFQMETEKQYFSFIVKTNFEESHHRFDQCGIVMYLDSENWLKGSIEYENAAFQHLGSVVTNHGYSDWATTEIPADVKSMWYRFSRREDDYCIECSEDGETDENLPYDRGRRKNPVRHLCMLSRKLIFHSRFQQYAADRMRLESP